MLCAALLLTILLATGPVGSDDVAYFRGATELLHSGRMPEVDTLIGRKLFILLSGLPAAFAGQIMYGVIANILYATLLNVVLAVFVFKQFGAVPALVAAAITSLNGVQLLWSGTMLPDTTLAVPMFLSVMSLYYALLASSKNPFPLMALSGALAGVSYAVKEPGILLLPPAIVSILLCREYAPFGRKVVSVAIYLAAFACLFAAEGLLQLSLSGDFFRRYHGLQAMQPNGAVPLLEFLRRGYWSLASIWRSDRDTLLFPMLIGTAAWLAILPKRSAVSVFGVAGLFIAGYLIFGSTSFSELHPMPFQPRYTAPLFPLIAVSLAALVPKNSHMSRWTMGGWLLFASLFAVLSISSTVADAGNLVRARYFKNVAMALTSELARNAGMPILVDPSTLEVLVHFMPRADYVRLEPIPSDRGLQTGFYLVDPYQDSIIRLQRAPHFEEIMRLPIAMAVNLNPFVMSRYFPDFRSHDFPPDPLFTAVIREKRPGP